MITGEVQTWHHPRKGQITGVMVHESKEWIVVKVVGDQTVYAENGATIVLRRSLTTLVPGVST